MGWIKIDYTERMKQEQVARNIRDLPTYKEFLEEWRAELQELEKNPEGNPERLGELLADIPKLEEEIRIREGLRDKQK